MSFLKNLVDNVTDYAYNKYNSINNTYKVPSDISELESVRSHLIIGMLDSGEANTIK
jgi:hypothetical protein